MSVVMKMKEVQEVLGSEDSEEAFAEPTARLAAEGKLDELIEMISPNSNRDKPKKS